MTSLDAHIDTPWQMLKHGGFTLEVGAPYSSLSKASMLMGGLDQAIFALYVSDLMREQVGNDNCYERILRQVQMLPEGHYTALEGGGVLGDDPPPRLRELADIVDLQYLTLVHNTSLDWVESATDQQARYDAGIRDIGWETVLECERLGILVDISHASDRTARDVLHMSSKPVIASHSGCKAILNNPRNLSDGLIEEIAETGGIVCIPLAKKFVGSIIGAALHINHVVQLVGVDHVGIGSDLDGAVMVDNVKSAADWSCWKRPLRGMSYSEADIDKIAGGNLRRVLGINEVSDVSTTDDGLLRSAGNRGHVHAGLA